MRATAPFTVRRALALGAAMLVLGSCTSTTQQEFGGTDVLANGAGGGAVVDAGSSSGPRDTGFVAIDVARRPSGRDTTAVDVAVDPADTSEAGDAAGVDVETPDPCTGQGLPFGCPCEENVECRDGFCVESSKGRVCTESCIDDCEDGWACRLVETPSIDPTLFCLERTANLCRPCASDDECRFLAADGGARCLSHGPREGSFCGVDCDRGLPCPTGFACEVFGDPRGGESFAQCVPEDGVCPCSPRSIAEGASTPCSEGQCAGVRECTARGLSECSAPPPVDETCDGTDNDCDGEVDEGLERPCEGPCAGAVQTCAEGAWGSCSVLPQAETCNEVDDDCDGEIDEEGTTGCSERWLDTDRDGFGVTSDVRCLCADEGEHDAVVDGDCDDEDAAVHPGAPEVCDGADNDCDPDTPAETAGTPGCVKHFFDEDVDGFGHPFKSRCLCAPQGEYLSLEGTDCDDRAPLTHPGASERCNGVDDDCDARVDERADAPADCPTGCEGDEACADRCNLRAACTTLCGAGEHLCVDASLTPCDAPLPRECADPANACAIFETCEPCPEPPAESCNGLDDDCDGLVDEGVEVPLFADSDSDGFGVRGEEEPPTGCPDTEGFAVAEGDCNDEDAAVHPGADERCNGVDDDCDESADETFETLGDPCDGPDSDACAHGTLECAGDGGDVVCGAESIEGLVERCNGVDDDCNGTTDELWPTLGTTCDGDDVDECPDGRWTCTETQTDIWCEDSHDPLVERCNGIDDDCSGGIDEPWPLLGGPCDGDDDDECPEGAWVCAADGESLRCEEPGSGRAELCNQLDDDCDSLTDEEWPGLGNECDGDDADQCKDGTWRCAPDGGALSCDDDLVAISEVCNGLDEDCDGETDERWPDLGVACDGADGDQCTDGVQVCSATGEGTECNDDANAHSEICNQLDDDCDGVTDETWPELGRPCDGDDDDVCADGQIVCAENGLETRCLDDPGAAAERCNGADDDCDDATDELWPELGEACDSEDADQCELGSWRCTADGGGVECFEEGPTRAESCNGDDDDCDGQVDELWADLGAECDGSDADRCSDGRVVCGPSGDGTICDDDALSINESCNGVDDDCDGRVDDGFVCSVGNDEQQSCGRCGVSTRTCTNSCNWGSWGTCSGEGSCAPGDRQNDPCGACGTRSRVCGNDCEWGSWSGCSGEGICSAGDTGFDGCGDCGTRTRTCSSSCSWGGWSGCSGEGVCTDGAREYDDCGQCGQRSRTCNSSCSWGSWGSCSGEGTCSPGQTDYGSCGDCGTRTRTCNSSCSWGGWSGCSGQGACSAGAREYEDCGSCGQRSRTCSGSCSWGSWGSCSGEGVCSPGDRDQDSCGDCGTRSRTCNGSCSWGSYGSCSGQGSCSSGARDWQDCGRCGTQSRTCSSSCSWGSWGSCLGQGACTSGETTSCDSGYGTRTCSSSCSFGSCVCDSSSDGGDSKTNATRLTDRSDCDEGGWRISGGQPIASVNDVDWYRMGVSDELFCSMDKITVQLSSLPKDYHLGVFHECNNGDDANLTCDKGWGCTHSGLQGCCSNAQGTTTENVEIDHLECPGGDDGGTLYLYVWPDTSSDYSCEPYDLSWFGF